MTFEHTNREEVIVRLTLDEAEEWLHNSRRGDPPTSCFTTCEDNELSAAIDEAMRLASLREMNQEATRAEA